MPYIRTERKTMSLFDKWIEDAEKAKRAKDKAERDARPKGQKCSTCKHMIMHPYSVKLNYCNLGSSKITNNGKATTKRGSWCVKWEAEP